MSGDLAATRLFPTPQPLYEERNTKVAVSTAIGFALATAGVVLRFTSRLLQRKRIDFSDYLIIAAYVFKLGLDISSIYLVRFGIGHHLQVVSFGDLRAYFQTLYVATWIYPLCIGFTKLSILSIYWNAFPSAYIRLSVKVVGAVIAAWAIACCLVGVFECTPVHKSWDAGAVGHCTDTRAYYRGLQVPNIITDFVILLLPLKAISELRLATNRNLELAGIFLCGVVAAIFDIILLVVLLRIPFPNLDILWNRVDSTFWTELQSGVVMFAACMPVMGPLLNFRQLIHLEQKAPKPQSIEKKSSKAPERSSNSGSQEDR